MKVVRPEWLVQSVEAGCLLPWRDFIFNPGQRIEASQGRQIAQKSLPHNLITHSSRPASQLPQSQRASTEASLFDEPHTAISAPPAPVAEPSAPSSTPERLAVAISDSKEAHMSTSAAAVAPEAGPSTLPQTPQKATFSGSSSGQPLYTTDPATPEQAKRVPGYAADKTNIAAQRAMADPVWRAAHTSVAPDFIEGFYRNSRLHHLSTWKAELRNLVTEAQDRAEDGTTAGLGTSADGCSDSESVLKIVQENMDRKGWAASSADGVSMRGAQLIKKSKGKGKEKAVDSDQDQVSMHCDFDSFFVAAGLVDRPHLRGKPVVVCHSQGNQGGQSSTSEIASASYEARRFGIRNGMRWVCTHLIVNTRMANSLQLTAGSEVMPGLANNAVRVSEVGFPAVIKAGARLTGLLDTSNYRYNSTRSSWRMPTTCRRSLWTRH